MNGNKYILGANIQWIGVILLFAYSGVTVASPPQLTVQPKGTNQVELTFGPVTPEVYYQVLARTNGPEGHWITFAGFIGDSNKFISATCDLGGIQGLTLKTLRNWKFVAGRWDDPLGDELPPLYKELVLRIDPYTSGDPYGNLMGDGWANLQKLQNNMDPFMWYSPPPPTLEVKFHTGTNNIQRGQAIVTWQHLNGPEPDYYLIERATRTMRRMTNNLPYGRMDRFPPGRSFSNSPPFSPRQPSFRPGQRPEEPYVTGPFQAVATVRTKSSLRDYKFIDPDVDIFAQPAYRMMAHYSPPLHARLDHVDANAIRKTLIRTQVEPTTNGYHLAIPHPIEYAYYLLLVRDKNDPQWRASGYFTSGTNRNSVYLDVDKHGMMSSAQSPIAMPEVKFTPAVSEPEFVAGWGEDSDGDGLPDIYEVMVTQTEPDNVDTGNTGTLDGYKDLAGDGWVNLEKFRRRINPDKTAQPPATVVLLQPNGREILKAVSAQSDLRFELRLGIRTNNAAPFQPIEKVPWMFGKIINFRDADTRRPFDLEASWRFSEALVNNYSQGLSDVPPGFQTIQALMGKINTELFEDFRNRLTNAPPLSPSAATNLAASVERAYRAGEIEKGVAMAELMTLKDNQAQDFYGQVIDQFGQPVMGAEVSLEINLSEGRGGSSKTLTDIHGLFQFTGIRGESLSITPAKAGYQIEGHGLGTKGQNGPETAPSKRAVYTMWKLKGPEPMLHDRESYKIKSDGRLYTIDLLSKKLIEGTNRTGDLRIQLQRPSQIKPHENSEWSFLMTVMGGGIIEVTNDDYLNAAPATGYHGQYRFDMTPANPKWRGWDGKQTFYLKSRDGKIFGHLQIQIDPVYRDGSALEIESYLNPAGSRNLEFDPAKQTQYTPIPEAVVPAPVPVTPKSSRIVSTNVGGRIVCWGSMALPLIDPETRFISVAAGGEHSLALKPDGTVVAWGRNLSGESTVPAGLSNVIAIAAGGRSNSGFSVALKRDGTVVAWGDNDHLQTGIPAGLSNVVTITAGTEHCLAIKKDGTVVGWGINSDGRTQSPAGLSNVVAVAAGEEHSVALKSDGTIVAWGRNQHGQAEVPKGLSNVVSICSGSYFNLALQKNGTVVGWGIDMPKDLTNITAIAAGPWDGMALRQDGTLIVWGRSQSSATQVPAGMADLNAFTSGGNDGADHYLALRKDGTIVGWGNNNFGQSLTPDALNGIASVAAGLGHYLAIKTNGTLVSWGGENHQGDGQARVPAELGPVLAAAGGWYHSLAVRSDGTVAGWGFRSFGQADPPNNLTGVTAVATGYNHSLALKTDSTVTGWGNSSTVPPSLSNVVAIAAATTHSLALKRDGAVVGWEQNGSLLKNVPGNLADVVAIAAGGEYDGDHYLALRRDGTVTAWGSNSAGQTNVPSNLTNVMAIAAGANHNLALRKDGTVVAWGANSAGQATVPSGLSNIVAIAAGGLSSVAIVVPPRVAFSPHVSHFGAVLIAAIAILIIGLAILIWLLNLRDVGENPAGMSQ